MKVPVPPVGAGLKELSVATDMQPTCAPHAALLPSDRRTALPAIAERENLRRLVSGAAPEDSSGLSAFSVLLSLSVKLPTPTPRYTEFTR
jgi:hypothetical protein